MNRSAGVALRRLPTGASGGFTIVELLVVASIMLGLFALILAGAQPNVGSEVRRAAQQFASLLLAAQSRAIGDPKGAAVMLELDTRAEAQGGPKVAGTRCVSVFAGDKPPFVVGTVSEGMPPSDLAATTASVKISPTNGGDLQSGFRVQFLNGNPSLPASVWFGFQPGPPTATQHLVSLRTDAGQSTNNTAWPTPVSGQMQARVACYPAKGQLAMEFPRTVAIDLRYSGTGDDPTSQWGGLSAKGDLAVSFDSVGILDALMRGIGGTAASRQPVEPVYFLVATRADIDKNEALSKESSLWVTIQPMTGRVTVSSNIAQDGNDQAAVRAARANARAALAPGK